MSKEKKESKPIQLMKVHFPDGVVVEVSAPYCTREEWAERTGMDKEVVQLALYNRQIARHKFSPKGDLFVNVIEEMRRLFDVQPWNR
ncbi:hypothetical protein [Marinomonas foliarum]|uniref:Uncharacterized protein n=1 Tax=Marinomonas foliarum TaxID=491950 RepID=A0ABX7IKE9_9GAMM|nr:hypothetical protein [Marinomonas foliarum]QRV22786.1 hypothetical protein JSY38_11980 [Marinomonas foliarum]